MIFSFQHFCHYGCGQKATNQTKSGKYICSAHHRSCPAVLDKGYQTNLAKYGSKTPAGAESVREKMRATTVEKYGVENASSLEFVKQIRRKKALAKYGVDNVSKADSIKKILAEQRSEYWAEVYKTKKFTADGLTRYQYGRRCHQYAETQYHRHQQQIDPEGKRSKHWHVDHIYSVTDGFLNDVPVNVISDISNLRLISDTDNYAKHKKSEKNLDQLYEDYLRLGGTI
jgi:CHAT domain-containing protein